MLSGDGDFEKFTRVQNAAWGVHAPQTVRSTSVGHVHLGLDAEKVSSLAVKLFCTWRLGFFLLRFRLNSFCRLLLGFFWVGSLSPDMCVYMYKCSGRGAHVWDSCYGSHSDTHSHVLRRLPVFRLCVLTRLWPGGGVFRTGANAPPYATCTLSM